MSLYNYVLVFQGLVRMSQFVWRGWVEKSSGEGTSGPPVFFCVLCGYKTNNGFARARRHERTHTKETPFECDLCGKKFSDKSGLNTHAVGVHRVHVNKKWTTVTSELRVENDLIWIVRFSLTFFSIFPRFSCFLRRRMPRSVSDLVLTLVDDFCSFE